MVETLRILLWRGRVRFRQRESTREVKTADTHMPPSRVKSENKRYANLPYEQSHPRIYLKTTPPQREIALLFVFLLARGHADQCDNLHVKNKALLPKRRQFTWPHVDVFDANRLCILSTSNLHCHWDSSAVSSLMPSPLSFRLEAKQVLNTLFGIFVCLIYANFYLTAHLTTVCFAYPCLLCCL